MGRETKLLLALLATLAGVFVGVLSIKLLVARPPVGAGPDVDVAVAEPHELVAPTLSAASTATPGDRRRERDVIAAIDDQGAGIEIAAATGDRPRRDPFVAAASFEQPPAAVGPQPEPPTAAGRDAGEPRPPSAFAAPASDLPAPGAPVAFPQAIEPAGATPEVDVSAAVRGPAAPSYVTALGDSWWDLAERAYGDGRLYRALRVESGVDPRVTLAGTRLEMPPRERLEAAWPRLAVPR